jgi:hypothetical protein
VALYILREHIGAAAVNDALRRFLEKYRGSAPLRATSLDIYAELRAVTPPPLHSFAPRQPAEATRSQAPGLPPSQCPKTR